MKLKLFVLFLMALASTGLPQTQNSQNHRNFPKFKANERSIEKQTVILKYRRCWNTCGPGMRCVFDSVTATVSCICRESCPLMESRQTQVCGSNGITYASLCDLQREVCKSGKLVTLKNRGSCIGTGGQKGNVFYVFASDGVHIVDPTSRSTARKIDHNDKVQGTNELMCVPHVLAGTKCDWADAVVAGSKYVFALDHSRKRIIVLDTMLQIPVRTWHVSTTIARLYYLEVLDELWLIPDGLNEVYILSDKQGHLKVKDMASVAEMGFRRVLLPGSETSLKWQIKLAQENCEKSGGHSGSVYYVNGVTPGFYEIDGRSKSITLYQNLSTHGCLRATALVHSTKSGLLFISCTTDQSDDEILVFNSKSRTVHPQSGNLTRGIYGKMSISPEGDFVVITSDHKVSVLHWNKWQKSLKRLQDTELYGFYPSKVAFSRIFGGYVIYVTSRQRPSIVKLRVTGDDVDSAEFLSNLGLAATFSGDIYELKTKQYKQELKKWFNETGLEMSESELMERVRDVYLSRVERMAVKGCGWNDRYIASPAAFSGVMPIIDGLQGRVVKVIENLPRASQVVWVGE